MKIFLSSVDTFLQNHVYEAFCAKDKDGKHEYVSTRTKQPTPDDHFERISEFISV